MASQLEAEAAALLVAARRDGQPLADLPPGLQPTTVAQAYAIQDEVLRTHGEIGGWKVAPADAEPRCAPIPARHIRSSPASFTAQELPRPEAEIEIALTLGRDLPPRATPYTVDDVRAAIATVHPAIEILNSRFTDRKAVSALTAAADSQSNAAVVLGEGRPDGTGLEFAEVAMRLRLNGAEAAYTPGGAATAVVLSALAWLANHAAARCGGLKAGQVIITGARLGPTAVAGMSVDAEAEGLGTVSLAWQAGIRP